MLRYIQNSGIFGYAIILFTLTGLIILSVKLTGPGKKKTFRFWSGLSLIPLVLGITGTLLGLMSMNRALAAAGENDPELIAGGKAIAMTTTYMGTAATIILIAMSLAGLFLKKDASENNSTDDNLC